MSRESYLHALGLALAQEQVKEGLLVPAPGSGLLVPVGSGSAGKSSGSGSCSPVPAADAAPVPVPAVPAPVSSATAVPAAHADAGSGAGGSTADDAEAKLSGWKKFSLAVTMILAAGLFAYAAAGSYTSVGQLAANHHVPLPSLVPLGIDGSLILALLADIVLTWIGHPIWWLRASARGFVAGSVAANAAAGWPDPIAVFLHCFPPVIIMLVTEAGRVPLLRKHAAQKRERAKQDGRDGIPWERWAAAPLSTLVMWRRMALWGVKSYEKAVAAEVTRRRAIVQLRVHFGRRWRWKAPGDLVWLLRTGNRLEEACAKVAAITEPDTGTGIGRDGASGTGNRNPRTRNQKRTGNRRTRNGNPGRGTGTKTSRTGNQGPGTRTSAGLDPALVEDVRQRIAQHRREHGQDPTVAAIAIAIGRRKTVAGQLMHAARAQGIPDAQAAEAQR